MDRLERVIAREMEARGLDSGPFAASSRYCQRLFDQLPELLGDEDERPDEWPGRVLQNETLPPRYREVIEAAEDGLARLGARLDGQPNEPLTYRGDGLFVRGAEPLRLEGQECMVMEALVELRAATKDDLVTKSGVSDAVDVLKRVKRKYPMLAAAILLPGGPRKGGYRLILAGP